MPVKIEEKIAQYTKELVSIRSVSGEEEEIAYKIREMMENEGIDKVFIDNFGNVIGVLKGNIDKTIIFEGHMDHVPEGNLNNWSIDPYNPKIVDGKIYGRATVDMKGAIASMVTSILKMKEKDQPNIYFIFVSQEENAEGILLKYALEESLKIKPDLVVIGEPTNLNISIGQRGRAVIHLEILGETAHASMPEKGRNAIVASAYIIQRILELNKKLPSHKLLGKSTITTTIIKCKPNSPPMIPDQCFINIDRRFIPKENREKIMNELNEVVEESLKKKLAHKIDIYIPKEKIKLWNNKKLSVEYFFPAWITNRNKTIKKTLKLVKRNVYRESRFMIWRFSTDGVYSAGIKRIPTIGFGPGEEELAHKPDEHVSIKHLVKAVQGYSKLPLTLVKTNF